MLHLPSRPSPLPPPVPAPPPAPQSPTSASSSPLLGGPPSASTNPTSPPSSLFELAPHAPNQAHANLMHTPQRVQRSSGLAQTAGTRNGPPREKGRKVEEMGSEEAELMYERNARVLADPTIFPPTSPADPHRVKLLEAQQALEHRIELLSTQTQQMAMSPPGSASSANTSFGGRANGAGGLGGSPVAAHSTRSTPSRRGLTTPLALAESLALQSDVFERERAREEARQAREMEREMSRMTIERTAGAGVAGGSGQQPGSGKLMDELERIRGEARMRSFMQPPRPISRDPFYDDDSDPAFSDDDDGDGEEPDMMDAELDDVDDMLGDGAPREDGGMMIISQEEVERGWVEDGRTGRGGSGMRSGGRAERGNG